jgi:hypothetical protein
MTSENKISYFSAKRNFNPRDQKDLEAFQQFVLKSNWDPVCPFILEAPFNNVVSMIERRIVESWIGTLAKQAVLT